MTDMNSYRKRVLLTGALVACAALVMFLRVIYLNVENSIVIPSQQQQLLRRGMIKDCSGTILAMSLRARSLYANPEEIESAELASDFIASVTGLEKNAVLAKISRKRKFVWIKRNLSFDEAEALASKKIKGLSVIYEDIRAYPHDSLGANIIGFCGFDNVGLNGIEYKYNDILNGQMSEDDMPVKGYVNGSDIILTIDSRIQEIAQREVQRVVTEKGAQAGSAVVLETKTGRILAIAKYPSFNPNDYRNADAQARKFFAVTDAFEPGSVMKAFSVSAWLEGTKNPEKEYLCTGAVQIGDVTINCTAAHGRVSMADAVRYSCNSAILSSVSEIPQNRIYDVMRRFGFGESTGCGIPGEAAGILRGTDKWSGLSKYSISIGQEISITIVQLAAAYSAIANNGRYFSPYIVDRIEDCQGAVLKKYSPVLKGSSVSEKVAKDVSAMLRGVVESGTGIKARMSFYSAAGKTGTARKYIGTSYGKNINSSSFAGFAPADDPEITVAVVIDEPQGITSAADVAAPIFSRIAGDTLVYRGNGSRRIKSAPFDNKKNTAYVFGGKMPDLRGMGLGEVYGILSVISKSAGVTYESSGRGLVKSQYPQPGEPLISGTKISVVFDNEL